MGEGASFGELNRKQRTAGQNLGQVVEVTTGAGRGGGAVASGGAAGVLRIHPPNDEEIEYNKKRGDGENARACTCSCAHLPSRAVKV